MPSGASVCSCKSSAGLAKASEMNTPGHRGLVLVLEDDLGISRLQRIHLERAGYRVDVATSTTVARAKLSAGRIELLLFDYQLNETVNGLEFYRSLQREGYDVPAILVTGFGDEARVVEAMRAGVRDFIPKTQNFVELVVPTVDRVMKQVRSERQLLEAEAASRAKDHFLATLSHELRTPLTPVLALVSALKRDDRLPQDVQEDISIISAISNSKRGSSMICSMSRESHEGNWSFNSTPAMSAQSSSTPSRPAAPTRPRKR